ncbi:PhzF family phenazine biosynthesis protein [Thiohalophilus thiocyanatoxydans]|uniref:Trans-2,3-dihydro-3-hydroxyanthranilate isomerase n=1 Tax=Thiohalophilus thiocyanatoxydans TaxID=381308 RepID=A0A4R8ITB7_9GAMM|nr:PhzF family phenazine biosynthesis protein [Thiohalophilus thiocyanatoxydans]TDY03654.1 trans-2,3-dihydro-3-hydroxyanthranilate isomerase [Thiohalophilus thiocyanatoxydans]
MAYDFYIVDVFAEQPYSGNPLAIVLTEQTLPEETMQRIAAETNFSETTFLTPVAGGDGSYALRIFTPSREIDFAGHPILGSAWILAHYVISNRPGRITINLKIGQIEVEFGISADGRETVWFASPAVSFGKTSEPEPVAAALGIAVADMEPGLPVQLLAAGTSAIIVPLKNLGALERCQLDLERYNFLEKQGFPPLVYVFCNETADPDNDLSARFFFEAGGVREDPATGNGAAFLGAYLQKYQYRVKKDFSLRIEQGNKIGRPSLIYLESRSDSKGCQVKVGGHIVPIVEGKLL